MRIAMDATGRVVVPKALRDELGIRGPAELDAQARDGVIEITVADLGARVEEHGGRPVIVAVEPVAPLTPEVVRTAIDRVRR